MLAFMVLGCGEEVPQEVVKEEQLELSIDVNSHEDGVAFPEGVTETFTATVPEDIAQEVQVAWYAANQLVCDWGVPDSSGQSQCDILMLPHMQYVSATVESEDSRTAEDGVLVTVETSQPPSISVLSPLAGSIFTTDELISFSAVLFDAEDDLTTLETLWVSSVDGVLSLTGATSAIGMYEATGQLSAGSHLITVQVTDSSSKTAIATTSVEVNEPPQPPSCQIIDPVDETLIPHGERLILAGLADDPDEPNANLQVRWTSDKQGELGQSQATTSGEVFLEVIFDSELHILTLEVTDSEGGICSDAVRVYVGNVPPEITTIELMPNPLVSSLGSECSVAAMDANGDDVSIEYQWFVDGQEQAETGDKLNGPFNVGSVVECVATPNDGGQSGDSASISATVPNSPPAVVDLTLTPAVPQTNDVIQAFAVVEDKDVVQQTSLTYEWSVDGVVVSAATDSFLEGALYFDRGQEVSLSVVVTDGIVTAAPFVSDVVEIANSPPTSAEVEIQDALGNPLLTPYAGVDNLICVITAAATDADGDPLSYNLNWMVDGQLWTGQVTTTYYPGDTIQASNTAGMQNWQCLVSASDGFEDSPEAKNDVHIGSDSGCQPFPVTVDTLDFDGMSYYPLNLDECTPSTGSCCNPTSTQEQMDQFCQLAGYCEAVGWTVDLLEGDSCYCWGTCSNNMWMSGCCGNTAERNYITSVECQ
ncbi:MAG: hypothetical protein CMK59_05365 [Proteobacteria bacterium]|nr:hypothetical protein [Pseudomonadota bacterium]